MTRPFGMPPPRAKSSDSEPVGMHSTLVACASPSFMIEPLPNCFSMVSRARPSALLLPSPAADESAVVLLVVADFLASFAIVLVPPWLRQLVILLRFLHCLLYQKLIAKSLGLCQIFC